MMTIVGPTARAAEYLRLGTPHLQACRACGERTILPVVLCRACGADTLNWEPLDPHGQVYAVTVVRRKPELGGDATVVLVDLDQGPRLLSRLRGVPAGETRIGMRVVAEVEKTADGSLLMFRPDLTT